MRHVRSALLAIALAAGPAQPASARAGWETPAWQAAGGPVAAPSIAQVVRAPEGDLLAATSAGLFASDDGARHWARVPDAPVTALIAVATTDDQRWVADPYGHVYGSGADGEPWEQLAGLTGYALLGEADAVYVPAVVGLATHLVARIADGVVEGWSTGLAVTGPPRPAGVDPAAHRVYVRDDHAGDVWWRSAGDATWTRLAAAGQLDELSVDATTTPATLVGVRGATLRRSVDGGATWTSTALPLTAPAAAAGRIEARGGDIVLTLGGYDVFGAVARSSDGGATWTTVAPAPGTSHTYAAFALGGGEVLLDTDAGPRIATPGGPSAPPAMLGRPSVDEGPQAGRVGTTYAATIGAWWGATSWSTQWQRCDDQWTGCSDIAGETGDEYTAVRADADHWLRVVVTAAGPAGSTIATSGGSTFVADIAPSIVTRPALTGDPVVGGTLAVVPGVWEGAAGLDWRVVLVCTPDRLRCDALGDVSTVPLVAAYEGRIVLVAEAAQNETAQAVAESDPVGPLELPPPDPPAPPAPPVPPTPPPAPPAAAPPADATPPGRPKPTVRPTLRARPAITGRARPGAVLRCSPGRWSGDPSRLVYRWLRNGRQLPRTVATYPVRPVDRGAQMACRVTVTNAAGSASATSPDILIPRRVRT